MRRMKAPPSWRGEGRAGKKAGGGAAAGGGGGAPGGGGAEAGPPGVEELPRHELRRPAVDGVADDRVADRREVDADLVRPAGDGRSFDERVAVQVRPQSVGRLGFSTARLS